MAMLMLGAVNAVNIGSDVVNPMSQPLHKATNKLAQVGSLKTKKFETDTTNAESGDIDIVWLIIVILAIIVLGLIIWLVIWYNCCREDEAPEKEEKDEKKDEMMMDDKMMMVLDKLSESKPFGDYSEGRTSVSESESTLRESTRLSDSEGNSEADTQAAVGARLGRAKEGDDKEGR